MPTESTQTPLDFALVKAGVSAGTSMLIPLAQGIVEAYNAYTNQTDPSLPDYQVVAKIKVHEIVAKLEAPITSEAENEKSTSQLTSTESEIGDPNSWFGYQLFGFAAYANDKSHNIIVLRGTQTPEEADYDVSGWGTNTACMLPSSGTDQKNYGNVNQSLYDFYMDGDGFTPMSVSFNDAVKAVAAANPGKPWYIAAHSLGGPLVTLGALDAYLSGSYANSGDNSLPCIVTFGSLHLGDSSFATQFDSIMPVTFRIANLCDFVPSLVSLEPDTPADVNNYVHVGLECTFVWQKWDNWQNHSMQYTYQPVIENYLSVVQVGPRQYPQ